MELVCGTLDQVYALRLQTLQEMGFIREVDRALAKSIMSEFIRLQLIVGDDLNTSLQAMHADLEATTDELIRDLDIAPQNSTDLPSENPVVRVALHRFKELIKLKLALPLAQVDAAHEDMDRFLQHRLEELCSQADTRNLIESLSQRVAAHQSRVCQIVYSEPLKHVEVTLRVLMGMAADQPVESNFFSGILEGLLGRLGIAAPREVAIILQAKSHTQAMGRLHLLKQLAYGKLCSGNLYKVQQLYMAMVRAIEEGESSWSSNFQLLEVLVMGNQPKAAHKLSKPVFEAHTESKEGKKVLFCKKYQLDKCQADLKNNTHWGTLGGKSQLLHHACATCLLKHKKSEHHHEKTSDCPLFSKD